MDWGKRNIITNPETNRAMRAANKAKLKNPKLTPNEARVKAAMLISTNMDAVLITAALMSSGDPTYAALLNIPMIKEKEVNNINLINGGIGTNAKVRMINSEIITNGINQMFLGRIFLERK